MKKQIFPVSFLFTVIFIVGFSLTTNGVLAQDAPKETTIQEDKGQTTVTKGRVASTWHAGGRTGWWTHEIICDNHGTIRCHVSTSPPRKDQ